jgi:hypothetical protein
MSADAIEILITEAIHTAFVKYPESDGGPNSTMIGLRRIKAPTSPAAPKSLEIYCADCSEPGLENGAQKARIRKPSGGVSFGLPTP